jgi:hypothetical protein
MVDSEAINNYILASNKNARTNTAVSAEAYADIYDQQNSSE